jgi:hypothetical protein
MSGNPASHFAPSSVPIGGVGTRKDALSVRAGVASAAMLGGASLESIKSSCFTFSLDHSVRMC